MFKGKTVVGIITAKANSKRFPKKNTQLLGEKPLISWTFDAVKKSKYLDRIILTTDSKQIIDLARTNAITAPFQRPPHLSTDSTTSEETVIHTLNWLLENENKIYDYIVLFQPTSPYRTSFQIDEAIKKIITNETANALVSVCDFSKKNLWLKTIDSKGYLTQVSNREMEFAYLPNGAIYIIKSSILIKLNTFYPPKTIPYIMDEISSLDIDTEADLKKAILILDQQYEKED